ncbi:hypothetical protein AX16_005262 [Volvariella volvacea WC 439]|nr:hypothetical protein AX16_005262 [Volvariella volvacea WC 439]
MPLIGSVAPPSQGQPYFRNLDELDAWAANPPPKLEGVLPYIPRTNGAATDSTGKLLVCHDYKGGYTETPFDLVYTFNYWSICETFVYFSHNRVAVPPPGWINAAHRQGAKMLGTLIFEGGSEADCLRLVTGKYPNSTSRPPTTTSFPLSDRYAKLLADLAYQRGFDGYLLNFETSLDEGGNQARAVAAWLTILQAELEAKVGKHAESIWYDSVVTYGYIYYQNRLNALNLPFFLSSTGLFTNYWWYPYTTSSTNPKGNVTYFNKLDPTLTGNAPLSQPEVARKQVNDVYIGIDVWGRGTFHPAGPGIYQALTHIAPAQYNLSVALFAPGWTWEIDETSPSWNWDYWWGKDHALWVGTGGEPAPGDPESNPGNEGPFVPVSSFFPVIGSPDPIDLPLHSHFSPGVGQAWFVNGIKVFQSAKGWADLDKQTSVGDLLWPAPALAWSSGSGTSPLPHGESSVVMADAWNGGSSVRVRLFHNLSFVLDTQPVWVPVQSLVLTPSKTYEASIVYKVEQPTNDPNFSVAVSVKRYGQTSPNITVTPKTGPVALPNGWRQLVIQFSTSAISGSPKVQTAIGFVISTSGTADSSDISLLLGQLNVYASLPSSIEVITPHLLWADFTPSTNPSAKKPSGTLTWGVGNALPVATDALIPRLSPSDPTATISRFIRPARYKAPATTYIPGPEGQTATMPVSAVGPEDTVSAWKLQPSNSWFPDLLYCNIYATRFASASPPSSPSGSTWIGTSGLDGQAFGFAVFGENLPADTSGSDEQG